MPSLAKTAWWHVRKMSITQISVLSFLTISGVIDQSAGATLLKEAVIKGINQPDLGWMPDAQMKSTLEAMKAASVESVRVVLTPPYDKSIAVAEYASKLGIKVLLNVNLNYSTYYPVGVKPTQLSSTVAWPLHNLDAERFATAVSHIWWKLDAADVKLVGIELGNEINWAGYNADLLPGGDGRSLDANTAPALAAMVASLEAYRRTIEALRALRSKSKVNGEVPLIFSGLAIVPAGYSPESRVGLRVANSYVRASCAHRSNEPSRRSGYPFLSRFGGARRSADDVEAEALTYCKAAGLPCWVTEMGVSLASQSCILPPVAENAYEAAIDRLRVASKEIQLAGIYLYNWSSEKQSYSVSRCGGILKPAKDFFNHN